MYSDPTLAEAHTQWGFVYESRFYPCIDEQAARHIAGNPGLFGEAAVLAKRDVPAAEIVED